MPVIFVIEFKSDMGLFEMTSAYTAFPENEVLIQDGLRYKVTEKRPIKEDGKDHW